MKQVLKTAWMGKMKFDAVVNGHHLMMDAVPEVGGEDAGPRPKELMIASLSGCTGMDVISILNKMRQEVESFNITVEAELTEEHPKHYYKLHLIYEFKGNNLDLEKLKKAVDLSQDKYCGVSAVYKKTMELTYEIKII
jgi:putative redox protein